MKLSQLECNLFLLFIAHPHHASASHALHKRMEAETSSLHIPHTTLPISMPQVAPYPPHECPPFPFDAIHFQGASLPAPIHAPPHVTPNPISFEEARPWKASHHQKTPRFYSHATDLEDTFANLLLNEEEIRPLIKTFIVKTASTQVPDQRIQSITEILLEVTQFVNKKLPEANRNLALRSQLIRQEFLSIASSNHGPDVVTWVGDLAVHHRSDQLLDAPRIIKEQLMDPPFPYLFSLHGILGPQNIFAGEIEDLLRNYKSSWDLPFSFKENEFVQDLINLRDVFAIAISCTDQLHGAKMDRFSYENNLHEARKKITLFRQTYVKVLGNSQAFSKLISNILESDVIKNLWLEVTNPSDLAGYELALIEPLGIAVSNNPETLSALQSIENKALENARERREIASRAQLLKEQLLEQLDPYRWQDLAAHLKRPNKRGRVQQFRHQVV